MEIINVERDKDNVIPEPIEVTDQQVEDDDDDLPSPPPLPTPKNMAEQRLFLPFVLGGFLLSLNAGFLNACFLFGEFGQPVGHVTGTITKFTYLISTQRFLQAWWAFSNVTGFFCGSLLSGLLIKKTAFKLRPRYGIAIIVEGCLLLMASLFLQIEGGPSRWADFLAAVACGLQNAMVAHFSQCVVRTTHMTGIVTDIGQVIGCYLRTRSNAQAETWKLKILFPLLLGFTLGGFIGSTLPRVIELGFVTFPSFVLCLLMGMIYLSFRAFVFIKRCIRIKTGREKLKVPKSNQNLLAPSTQSKHSLKTSSLSTIKVSSPQQQREVIDDHINV